jgi:hypothetical protein
MKLNSKIIKISITYALLMLYLLSCGCGSVIVHRGGAFPPDDLNNLSLAIMPFPKECSKKINYSGDVVNDFGVGEKPQLILNYFYNEMRFGLRDSSIFVNVYKDSSINPCTLIYKEQIIRGDTLHFLIPKVDSSKNLRSSKDNLVLIITTFGINDYITFTTIPGTFIPIPANRILLITCKYVLWDNQKNDVVYFGNINLKHVPQKPIITVNEWKNAVNAFAGEIVRKTIFYSPNYN